MPAVSAKQVGEAIKRLREVIPMSNQTPSGQLEEVVVRLRRNVDDAAHLSRVISRLIDGCDWFPTVAQVVKAINETAATGEALKPVEFVPMGCEACGWTGYLYGLDQAGHEAVRQCRCLKENRMQPRPADWWKRDAATRADFDQVKREVAALVQRGNL